MNITVIRLLGTLLIISLEQILEVELLNPSKVHF
jgi:hypothetical protein